MDHHVNRKSFLAGLGAAGLGLAAGISRGAASAMAQEESEDAAATGDTTGEWEDPMEKRLELYNAFTAALAAELNVGSADEIDGAIRIAIMNVIDGLVGDDGLTVGQAEALKHLVATSDVPFPMMMGHGPGGPGGYGHGSMGHGSMGPGREHLKERIRLGERHEGEDGPDAAAPDSAPEPEVDDDSASDS
jgi:hypothetical protein